MNFYFKKKILKILTKKKILKIFYETNDDLSDKQAIAIFNYLLKTKDLGSDNEKKKETIIQIKDSLMKWL